jgi:uncharacterized RDD family membrane protein YckC
MSSSADYWEDYEVVTIETPEALELRLPLAGFGPRLLALVVDWLIQGVVVVVLVFIMIFIVAGMAAANPSDTTFITFMMIGMFLLIILATVGYYIVFELLWNGQTPGKRAVGIRVVKRGGLPLTPVDVVIRNLVRIVDLLPSSYLIGVFSFFLSKNQQRLGDLAADTVVIREFGSQLPYTWVGALQPGTQTITPAGITLDTKSAYIISNLLARRFQLSPDTRFLLAGRVIERLGYSAANLTLDQREGYLASLVQQHLELG